jgi:hypothetical protein
MKNIIRISLSLAMLTILLVIACEPIDNPSDSDPRDQYVGEWQFNESLKNTLKMSYLVTISKDPSNSSQIILENFGNSGIPGDHVKAIVTSGQISIPKQDLSISGWVTEGSGQMSNPSKKIMNLSYYFIISADKEYHTTTATKL